MKKIWGILLAIVLLCVFMFYANSSIPVIISSLSKNGQIGSGDLVYRVYLFGVIPLGEAIIYSVKTEDYNGIKAHHLSAQARTSKSISKIFKAAAIIDSYIDAQNGSPFAFKQKLIARNKEQFKEVTYDQKEGTMAMAGVKRQILADTHDPLSALFRIRHLDFSRKNDFEINLNTNQKNYILEGDAEEKDIFVKNKPYKVVIAKASIRRRDKNPYHKSKVKFIFLKGEDNFPICIQVFAGGIFLNVKLVEIR